MTLYLKYRPQTIDELDLESVRESLKAIVKSGNIPHSFLFSGPKGTGKTSAARILAKIINCQNLTKDGEPCNKCASCVSITKGNNIDIIELDAASNRGIDDIRNLKEGIYLTPAAASKKVYIIDEAHMLTLEAANAFLKTLEEPPPHVVFILATTNPEKLPATVISRLTAVNFVKARESDIARQLGRVAKGEKIKIDKSAISKIAKLSDGSFRDAVKILENLSFKTKDIKETDIENLFSTSSLRLSEFIMILESRNAKKALEFIEELVRNGVLVRNFGDEVMDLIHKSILAKNGLMEDLMANFQISDLFTLNELLSEAREQVSPVAQLPLEIAVVKFCSSSGTVEIKREKKEAPKEEVETKKVKVEKKMEPEKKEKSAISSEVWQKLLQSVKEKNVSIEALLRSSQPISFDGKTLNVGVYYQFHKDRLEDGKNTRILEEICKGVFDVDVVKVNFELIERLVRPIPQSNVKEKAEPSLNTKIDKDIIDAAKEIFG